MQHMPKPSSGSPVASVRARPGPTVRGRGGGRRGRSGPAAARTRAGRQPAAAGGRAARAAGQEIRGTVRITITYYTLIFTKGGTKVQNKKKIN